MSVTDQINVLDRKAAKISALSSNNLDKHEYLTDEDLGLKPSTVEQEKFEYSPLGMSLSKVLKKDELKGVAKSMSDFNYDSSHTYKQYDKFKEISTESGYNNMKDFNKLLINFERLKTKKTEAQLKKERIIKNVDELYKNYFDAHKSNYDAIDTLGEDEKKKFNYKQFELGDEINKEPKLNEKTKEFEIIDNRDQRTKLTKKEKIKTKKPDEIQKPLWVKINKNNFNSLIQDVDNNLNSNEFKTTVNKKFYDLENAKTFLVWITTQKVSEKKGA